MNEKQKRTKEKKEENKDASDVERWIKENISSLKEACRKGYEIDETKLKEFDKKDLVMLLHMITLSYSLQRRNDISQEDKERLSDDIATIVSTGIVTVLARAGLVKIVKVYDNGYIEFRVDETYPRLPEKLQKKTNEQNKGYV